MELAELVGKTIARITENEEIIFTDGCQLYSDHDGILYVDSAAEAEASRVKAERSSAIMKRFWDEHNQADRGANPEAVEVGYGGFFRLKDAPPWPTLEEDIKFLKEYRGEAA